MSRLTKLFQNRLTFSLLTVAIVALFIKLSIWQWHRYQFKKHLEQTFVTQWHATPQDLLLLLAKFKAVNTPMGYEKIFASGHYEKQQFLLDNRTKNNQVGFDVITPFQLNNGQTILVDRGFIPADIHRHIHADITPPNTSLLLIGLLTQPSKSFVLGPVIEAGTAWPRLIMRIDLDLLAQSLQTPLLPAVILLDHNVPYGFVRQWSPPNLWAAQSLGYCFQWLAMALAVIIIYFIMLYKSQKKKDVS